MAPQETSSLFLFLNFFVIKYFEVFLMYVSGDKHLIFVFKIFILLVLKNFMCASVYLLACTYTMFMQFPRRSE